MMNDNRLLERIYWCVIGIGGPLIGCAISPDWSRDNLFACIFGSTFFAFFIVMFISGVVDFILYAVRHWKENEAVVRRRLDEEENAADKEDSSMEKV